MSDWPAISSHDTIGIRSHWALGKLTRIEITHAPDVASFSSAIFEMANPKYLRRAENGDVIVRGDWPDGRPAELTYRPIRFDQDGRVIVCEKVS